MRVEEIMTANPACCSSEARVQEAARLMVECDCGEIPVIDAGGKPLGVITDRDIACRVIAEAKGPDTHVREAMTEPAITVSVDMSVEECCRIMEENQVRRVPVVDAKGVCCGMLAQADIALEGSEEMTAELVRDVSMPTSKELRPGSRAQ
jgi:CBS domain-containing protein